MIPVSISALAVIAVVLSISAAATSLYLMRERRRWGAPPRELTDLEQAVAELMGRLETTAGRCIHDLESREAALRRLIAGEADGLIPAAVATEGNGEAATGALAPSCAYFETDVVARSAQALALVEQRVDEATICRTLGMQRAELQLMLSLRAAQLNAA